MVRALIVVPIKEDQIALLRFVAVGLLIHILAGEELDPRLAVGLQRHFPDLCVVETEGDKHGAPVPVRRAVPRAIAGISSGRFTVFQHDIILPALPVTPLRLGDFYNIIRPVAGQFHILKRAPPYRFLFHIRIEIGITDQRMRMFLKRTAPYPCTAAQLGMDMPLALIQAACGRIDCAHFVTGIYMGMRLFFRHIACQNLPVFALFQRAGQHAQLFKTALLMRMAFAFRLVTDQHRYIARHIMLMIFRFAANQLRLRITAAVMLMFFLAALQ